MPCPAPTIKPRPPTHHGCVRFWLVQRGRSAARFFDRISCRRYSSRAAATCDRTSHGSVLIVVLWVAFGLVSIALYFADAMSCELRASDNQVCGLAAEQAIEGAARYVTSVLEAYATNGVIPDLTRYQAAAVPVGDAHFWFIGRNPAGAGAEPYFGLIDEASKINLNSAATNVLLNLPNMTADFAQAIVDWRAASDTDLSGLGYAQLGYVAKHAPFETVDELRLVRGAGLPLLVGDDLNRNGIHDDNEVAASLTSPVSPGLFEVCTVFSREPNMNGATSLTNVNDRAALQSLLQAQLGAARSSQVLSRLVTRVGGGRGRPPVSRQQTFSNLLRFYLQSGLTAQEFGLIAGSITASTAPYLAGRVNVNTASATVLACLPGLDLSSAQQLVTYRTQNPGSLGSIAWIVDALGAGNTAIQTLAQADDVITTHSYQFTADVAALGPHGRGYRRTRFVFDVSTGTVRIVYRQDLGRLGWALGKAIRTAMVEHAPK